MNIKDRHNGNILMDSQGHIIHIDFGFMISNSPGGGMNFETAPFKLTGEYLEVMGGRNSELTNRFRRMCVDGFIHLRERKDEIIGLIEMIKDGEGNTLPCFVQGDVAISNLKTRFTPNTKMTESRCKEYINDLINQSIEDWTSTCYDRYQYCCQNILY
jgi:phosphatidylinositol kinase/protein kinase (PI-3  family)